MDTPHQKLQLLFVCMGNICRSPSAEAVMTHLIEQTGLTHRIFCDSAGTIAYHAGEPADARMMRHASKRGYNLTSISRQIKPADFERFDYIMAMDTDNLNGMNPFIPQGNFKAKIKLMTDFCNHPHPGYVPDPYYGGAEGFEQVLDILEDACSGFLNHLMHKYQFNTKK